MKVVCDASASMGSRRVDINKYASSVLSHRLLHHLGPRVDRCTRPGGSLPGRYDVIYAAAHKNFSTSGVCYMIVKKELINDDVLKVCG